jgi:DNA-damage-inducible protein D
MNATSPDFDSIKQTNPYGQEYWSARVLMPLLGYGKKWQNFETVINKGMTACTESGNIVEQHFTDASKSSPMPHGGEREVKDYFLSRFACYLIAQNGDPRKPEIASAQVYFAVSTRAFEIHQLRKEQEERLEMRLKVSESYKQLAKAAQGAGVQSERFGIFVDAGYLGLHRHSLGELKERKGVPEDEEYLDRIGRQELSAIDFKNTQTESKLIHEHVAEEDDAVQTHYFVGDQVRKAIEAIKGPMPEDLPTAPSIRALLDEKNRKRKKLKSPASPNEQENLF